jgi:hypothetical protein
LQDFGPKGASIEFERLLTAAIEEQVRLDLRDATGICFVHISVSFCLGFVGSEIVIHAIAANLKSEISNHEI